MSDIQCMEGIFSALQAHIHECNGSYGGRNLVIACTSKQGFTSTYATNGHDSILIGQYGCSLKFEYNIEKRHNETVCKC